jgi:hypothetical protein
MFIISLMGLYKGWGGGLIYGGLIHEQSFVSNKQVSHKQENKHVLIKRFD